MKVFLVILLPPWPNARILHFHTYSPQFCHNILAKSANFFNAQMWLFSGLTLFSNLSCWNAVGLQCCVSSWCAAKWWSDAPCVHWFESADRRLPTSLSPTPSFLATSLFSSSLWVCRHFVHKLVGFDSTYKWYHRTFVSSVTSFAQRDHL